MASPHRSSGAALGCALALICCAAPFAFAEDDEPGEPLTSEELREAHAGRSVTGCYVDREEDHEWAEHMAADGRLYDLEKQSALVGSWWVDEGGVICFFYTDDRAPGPHCYTGRRRGQYLDYYTAPAGDLSATTDCGESPVA